MSRFQNKKGDLDDPALSAAVITPDDDVALENGPTRGLAFSAAGILELTMLDGVDVIIPSGVLAPGVIHPLRVTHVKESTTATDVVGFW